MVGFTIWRVKVSASYSRELFLGHLSQQVMANQIVPNDDGASDWSATKCVARGIACAKCKFMTTELNYVLELIS